MMNQPSWHERARQYREQRQQQAAERRRLTCEALATTAATREATATEVRTRRSQERQMMAEAQAEFLRRTHEERTACAALMRAGLAEFRAELAASTGQLLEQAGEERRTMGAELRLRLGRGSDERRKQTRQFLNNACRLRRSNGIRRAQQLQRFHRQLQRQIGDFLGATSEMRAQQFAADSACRAKFCEGLRRFRATLHAQVWGSSALAEPAHKPVASVAVPVVVPSDAPLPEREQRVHQYLANMHGAAMQEIESGLSINRFQATDALRALIDKGLIVKRGRQYLLRDQLVGVE